MTIAKIVRKIDRFDLTFDGHTYTVFDGLQRIGNFTAEESAANYAIDMSRDRK